MTTDDHREAEARAAESRTDHDVAATDPGRPIVIIGISRRSGTNFLTRLLALHPDCTLPPPPVKEDFLLVHSRLLQRYARRTAAQWPRRWGDRAEGERALVDALGHGLVHFLTAGAGGRRTVTKTPNAANLDLAPMFLDGADVIVLVRDGRSVAQSIHGGYRRTYTGATKQWRRGARSVLDMQRRQPGRVHVVRYEDVLADRAETFRGVLRFCSLDESAYDFAAASALPVAGSSFIKTDDGGIDWAPKAPDATFQPADRSADWSDAVRSRFDWLAGTEQRALGYPTATDGSRSVSAIVRNLALDLADPVIRARDGSMWIRHRLRLLEQSRSGRR